LATVNLRGLKGMQVGLDDILTTALGHVCNMVILNANYLILNEMPSVLIATIIIALSYFNYLFA